MDADIPHILVVDDDDRLRELLRKFLCENGFMVSTASDAADARAKLAGLTFDLIVLDLMMPGESGLEFGADLRTRSNVPILMLTAMGEPEDRITGLETGADDYLTKPFEPRELLLRIRSVLRRRPPKEAPQQEIRMGDVVFDPAPRTAQPQRPADPADIGRGGSAERAVGTPRRDAEPRRTDFPDRSRGRGPRHRRAGHPPAP